MFFRRRDGDLLASRAGAGRNTLAAGIDHRHGDASITCGTISHVTTRTVLQQDGPDHLGLWLNAIPEHQMAVITSGTISHVIMALSTPHLPWQKTLLYFTNPPRV